MSAPRSWCPDGVIPSLAESEPSSLLVPRAVAAGVADLEIGPEDLFLASEVARLVPPGEELERQAALLLALTLLAATREGSTRVAVDELALRLEELGGAPTAIERALERVTDPPASSGWLGRPGDYLPLLSDGRHLSSHRLRNLEARLASRLRIRMTRAPDSLPQSIGEVLDAIRERPPILPGGAPILLSVEQERAVRRVLARPLCLVTGGPGTGKTSVVVSILRAFARCQPWSSEAVALAAPTGRAADRLLSSLLRFLDAIPDPPSPDRALRERPPEASTLHRLLGYSPRRGRFRHHENHPLAQDLVVVDEGSMVDLELMERLMRSVRPDARLVLLGDADQLPSVGAGAVFRDLGRSSVLAEREATVRLTHSYRMDAEDPAGRAILRAAERVRSGRPLRPGIDVVERSHPADVDLAGVELLTAGRRRRLAWWELWARSLPGPAAAANRTFRLAADDDWRLEDAAALDQLFETLEAARILTPHRGLAAGTGAAAINRWFHSRHARENGLNDRASDPLPGEPVLIIRNDDRRGLFNGDQGLVIRVQDRTGAISRHALFRIGGELRSFPVESLRSGLELAWATTVHKAQGSEMDRVTLVLPDRVTRILDRELVYTAITRARRSVVILGSSTVLAAAVGRTLERSTGLTELLREPEAETPRDQRPRPGSQLSLWD